MCSQVCIDFRNLQRARDESRDAVARGFTGKQAIHPAQVEAIAQGFAPPEEDAKRARRIVEANEKHQADGVGASAGGEGWGGVAGVCSTFCLGHRVFISVFRSCASFFALSPNPQGAFSLDNVMIDMPMVRWAHNVLARNRAAKLISGENPSTE